MPWVLVAVSVISFFATLLLMPRFKAYLENSGIVDMDIQKRGKPWMASSGGLPVAFGFLAGVLFFIFLDTFVLFTGNTTLLFAATLSVVLAMLIGLLDDVHARRRVGRKGPVGLKQWQKPLLTVAAAVPLMAVKAGVTFLSVPFFGDIEFGILYPLVLVPIAVICVTNATNMLAGLNGLEAGLGSVALIAAGFYALVSGSTEAAVIGLTVGAALLAFLVFNFHPARFLPGDSLTYLIGAAYVSTVVLGNIEKFGVLLFTPWIIEAFLKLRSGFKASSTGVLQADGTLKPKYDKIYSLTHAAMRLGKTERRASLLLIGLELLVVLISIKLVTVI